MKQTTLQLKAERLLALDSRRKAHHRALASLHVKCPNAPDDQEQLGLKLWRKLRALESSTHDATTAQCNGASYRSQPFRDETVWDDFKLDVERQIVRIFGNVPDGFHINGDARGYALVIDSDSATVPAGMVKNWGNDGVLAAEIND